MTIKIGLFDSGIGGFSILREIHSKLPQAQVYYFSDSFYNPYGNKDEQFILARAEHITQLFIDRGVSHILIACNTATAIAIDYLRQKYKQIKFFGIEPYLNIINQSPALKERHGAVLVTQRMSQSSRYLQLKSRLDPNGLVDTIALKNLAHIIETNFFSKNDLDLKVRQELTLISPEIGKYDYFILGCTHYPLVIDCFKSLFKQDLYSPCPYVAKHLLNSIDLDSESGSKDASPTFTFIDSSKQEKPESLSYRNIF